MASRHIHVPKYVPSCKHESHIYGHVHGSEVLLQIFQRIHLSSVHKDLEMYMRSGASAGIAAQCDLLVLIDFLAYGYQDLAQMAVSGHLAVRVTDGDTVTISAGPAGADNGSAA